MSRTTDSPRTAVLTLRLTPDEKAAMKERAAKAGKSVTAWLCELAAKG